MHASAALLRSAIWYVRLGYCSYIQRSGTRRCAQRRRRRESARRIIVDKQRQEATSRTFFSHVLFPPYLPLSTSPALTSPSPSPSPFQIHRRMLPPTLLVALVAAAAPAHAAPNAPNAPKISTSIDSCQKTITKYRPGFGAIAPLSTNTRTTSHTVYSTITTCGAQSTVTTTITPHPVTHTVNGTNAYAKNLLVNTGQECTSTTTISQSVATVYTGTYSASQSKRSAAPPHQRSPLLKPNLLGKMFHRLGQNALLNQKAFEVDCLEQVTTHVITTTTIHDAPATETVTAETPIVYVTRQDGINAVLATAPVNITTTLTARPAVNTSSGGVCTVTAGASSTTTQHLKCAPTNLISEVDGKGIGQTQGDESNTRGLADGTDPSACCQLCVDTEDCAASEDDPDAGNCFLWYSAPSCGRGFNYSVGSNDLAPGAGFLLQTGCGTIAAVDTPTA
ncbi:hypothetical protein AC578_7293 [Pseudocercospora eumusae]|uniref:Uncharacterized protein n=1 Tax=Pseudocercospora eumusae TaxID=321146 RepID=A0A139HWS0_9PEZI|nr:hypothetical protein AC578_7293 [Pseudocercospora eumusae]